MSEQLAIYGGKPTVPAGRIKPWPHITEADRQAVMEVLAGEGINEQRRIQSDKLSEEWAARQASMPTFGRGSFCQSSLYPQR